MREIEFRGKSIMEGTEGRWLYSFGIKYGDDVELLYCDEETSDTWYYVNKETIGQYTGLKDKNGKKIFEGDIVKFRFKKDRAECPDLIGYIEYQSTFTGFRIMSYKGSFKIDALETIIEVVGNIYDNPELLKEEL